MRRIALCLFAVSLSSFAADLTPTEIVQRACDREAANQEVRRQYTYRETMRQRAAKHDTHETHDIFYIAGKEYRKLVEKDGKPLSPSRAANEQERLDKELAKARRELPDKAEKRLAEDRREQQEFRDQVAQAFQFRLVGEEDVSGKPCYRIHAEPKPGFKAKGDAKVLSKLKGDIWIDKAGFHWAKVDLESVDTISGMGGLVRLAKGTRLVTTRTYVNNEVWFPNRIDVKATAKALLFISAAIDMQVQYSDFKKFSVDSKVLVIGE
jgi:hypothetical protein